MIRFSGFAATKMRLGFSLRRRTYRPAVWDTALPYARRDLSLSCIYSQAAHSTAHRRMVLQSSALCSSLKVEGASPRKLPAASRGSPAWRRHLKLVRGTLSVTAGYAGRRSQCFNVFKQYHTDGATLAGETYSCCQQLACRGNLCSGKGSAINLRFFAPRQMPDS